MKKRIESLIPIALEVLDEEFKDGKVPSEFNGYISAFGAGIIQSGLKPTIAIYENTKAGENKNKLVKIILKVIKMYKNENIDIDSLLRYVISSDNEIILKELIKDCAIAIKLTIRTFEFKKEN